MCIRATLGNYSLSRFKLIALNSDTLSYRSPLLEVKKYDRSARSNLYESPTRGGGLFQLIKNDLISFAKTTPVNLAER